MQVEAGKEGEKMSNSLFSIGFFSGIKFYFHFLYLIAGSPANGQRVLLAAAKPCS